MHVIKMAVKYTGNMKKKEGFAELKLTTQYTRTEGKLR